MKFSDASFHMNYMLFFQLPVVLSQTQGVHHLHGASNVPFVPPVQSAPTQPPAPVLQSTQSFSFPGYQSQPVFSGLPPAVSNQSDSESDTEIPSLALPCRAGSAISENFLPMISTEDKWLSDPDYR